MKTLKKIIKDYMTGIDGKTYDPARGVGFFSVGSFVVLGAYAIIKGQTFDAQGFGIGLGALLAGAGAYVGLKAKTEPGTENGPANG